MKDSLSSSLEEHKTHGGIDFPLNVYYTILGKTEKDLYLHWHKEMEFIYIKSGSGLFYIDLSPISVKEGDILIVPPFSLHSGKPHNNFCECKTLVFNLSLLKTSSADTISVKYINPIIEKKYTFPLVISKENQEYKNIADAFLVIVEYYEKQIFGYEMEIKAKLFQLFSIFFQKHIIKINENDNYIEQKSEKIKSILEYVAKYYKSNITVTEVANYLDYSENHFCRFFKSQTGSTFVDYLNSFRLNAAQNLLLTTNKSVTQIALESGYNNLSYFIRIFKKMYSCTPYQFRKFNINSNTM